jgi:hypothetical protein
MNRKVSPTRQFRLRLEIPTTPQPVSRNDSMGDPDEADLVFELGESRVRGVKPAVRARDHGTVACAPQSDRAENLGLDRTGIGWARTAAEARFIL